MRDGDPDSLWRVVWGAVVILIMTGCGEPGKRDSSESGPARSDSPGSAVEARSAAPVKPLVAESREAQLSLRVLGVEGEMPADAWPTEVFHERAKAQLDRLKHYLTKGGDFPEGLRAASFVDRPLRPVSPETIFTGSRFVVDRAGPEDFERDADAAEGGPFLETWATAYRPGTVEAWFKIFQVEKEPTGTTTRLWANLSGAVDDGWRQESATWTCVWTTDDPPLMQFIEVTGHEMSQARTGAEARPLNDCTEAVFDSVQTYADQLAHGIDHWEERLEATFGVNVSGWESLALGDVNGDGLDDVYVCQPGGLPNRLFLQKPDGTVFDASSFSGVDWRLQTQSALLVDLDNDGDQDLALATTLGLLLMANDGRGAFTVKVSELLPEAAPMGLSSADFDFWMETSTFAQPVIRAGAPGKKRRSSGALFPITMPITKGATCCCATIASGLFARRRGRLGST